MQNQGDEYNFWRDEFLKQQREIERMRQTMNQILQKNQQIISGIQSSLSHIAQTQSMAAQLAQQMRANFSRTESAVAKMAKQIKNVKLPSQSMVVQEATQLERQIKRNLLNVQPAILQLGQIERQIKRDLLNVQPAILQLEQLERQMRRDLLNVQPAILQLGQLERQMRRDLLNVQPAATQLAKQTRIDLLPNRAKIPEELLFTVEHFSQDAVVMIDGGVTENVDESDSKLINESLNPYNKNLPKSSREKLSAWVPKLSEEYRAYLIDYQKSWYEGKPLTWRTHLYVELLTLQFLLIDVLWSHISYQLQKWFRPVHRPRL
ncbi:hypothetical protein [Nostoc sp. FACHB-145]|uniref:hypothetical protein n=1 Tax=Nostoc sp. FACHB-145 TaxID=2692836 RepID=UPI00168697E4|nr:hypothetical protein [Nostoc sp. FACHB-145]MBD2472401.1 hypothetical protein [Nostoc sp. FACHB-145]